MWKIGRLLTNIEQFVKLATESAILAEADRFDIVDETLYNQLESFISAYKELMDSLNVSPENLTADAMQNAIQLIDTLNKRYERILSNPYLNGNEDWSEDFDPGELTEFVQKAVVDAENKIKEIGGEDINLNEMRAAQYAEEFNQQGIDKGDTKITYTGNKVEQLLNARRKWFKDLMFVKKLGKDNPNYQRYENYIASRKRSYQNLINDPVRGPIYKQKLKERSSKSFKSITDKEREIKQLMSQLSSLRDPQRKKEIEEKLKYIQNRIEKRQNSIKNTYQKRKELRESYNLLGSLEKLRVKIHTAKHHESKKIKDKAAKDPQFNIFKEEVKNAHDLFEQNPTPENKAKLEKSIKAEADALNKYLNDNPLAIKIITDLNQLINYKDKVKEIASSNNIEQVPNLIEEGLGLINSYQELYKPSILIVKEVVKQLQEVVNEK